MRKLHSTTRVLLLAAFIAAVGVLPQNAFAHCDTTQGPVVLEARKALEAGEVTPLLKWIAEDDEAELTAAFNRTLKLRGNEDAEISDLADMYFLETFVRLHRMSEGVGYTGISNEPVAPAIAAADLSLETGSTEALADLMVDQLRQVIQERFDAALASKAHADHTVEAGRAYVHNYVLYTHLIEELDHLIKHAAEAGHGAATAGHHH